jgi:hypothetical protein
LRDDADVADARAGRLELGEGGNALLYARLLGAAFLRARLLRAGRLACPGQRREANWKAIPEQVILN